MSDRMTGLAWLAIRDPAAGGPGVSVLALGWGTALPPFRYTQRAIADWLAQGRAPREARRIRAAFRGSGIETRSSCLPDFVDCGQSPRLFRGSPPSTGERMDAFAREAPALAAAAAARALAAARVAPERITHVFVVTCTGFTAPGIDSDLIESIGLSRDVQRVLFGFQGCAAGVAALRTAAEIVRGNTDALVLVVSVELSSLHYQPDFEDDDLRGHALFADGAGAAVVGAGRSTRTNGERSASPIALGLGRSRLVPETRGHMTWRIGDRGFLMRLAADVPERLALILPEWVASFGGELGGPRVWAVHPGGPAILDRIESSLALTPDALAPSRAVLRANGNMSSATIFFVLEELLRRECDGEGLALAFGPGLLVEGLAFRRDG